VPGFGRSARSGASCPPAHCRTCSVQTTASSDQPPVSYYQSVFPDVCLTDSRQCYGIVTFRCTPEEPITQNRCNILFIARCCVASFESYVLHCGCTCPVDCKRPLKLSPFLLCRVLPESLLAPRSIASSRGIQGAVAGGRHADLSCLPARDRFAAVMMARRAMSMSARRGNCPKASETAS
jgi:hypothetical protein